MIKQRSRSADALDLLKDETIFEERTAGVESAHALDAVIGHESSATGNNRNNQPTPAAAVSVSGIVVEAGVPKTSSDSTALDVSAIAERHQQEQLDEAWDALAVLLQKNMIQQKHVTVFQTLYRENIQGKEKVTKLKNLLARSAKVQKDQKNELSQTKGSLEEANQIIASLHTRIDQLANRPTHYLEIIADFESNFDRALQAIHPQYPPQLQPTRKSLEQDMVTNYYNYNNSADTNINGQNTKQFSSGDRTPDAREEAAPEESESTQAEQLLLQAQLEEAKAQCQKLESLNTTLLNRANRLEKLHEEMANQREEMERNMALLTAELRSTKAELDHTLLQQKEYVAKSAEMQMEIDFLTKSSLQSNQQLVRVLEQQQRTHQSHGLTNDALSSQSVKQQQKEMEAKVTALTEWALASAEAKQLAVEHAKHLEHKVHELMEQIEQQQGQLYLEDTSLHSTSIGRKEDYTQSVVADQSNKERKLWSEHSSMVIGAGLEGSYPLEYRADVPIHEGELILLRWKFDVTPSDMDIYFSVYKGRHLDNKKGWESADPIIKNRRVIGGGGGDIEGAFAVQNACTLVWSNTHSWIRPRTIKFVLEVYAITE